MSSITPVWFERRLLVPLPRLVLPGLLACWESLVACPEMFCLYWYWTWIAAVPACSQSDCLWHNWVNARLIFGDLTRKENIQYVILYLCANSRSRSPLSLVSPTPERPAVHRHQVQHFTLAFQSLRMVFPENFFDGALLFVVFYDIAFIRWFQVVIIMLETDLILVLFTMKSISMEIEMERWISVLAYSHWLIRWEDQEFDNNDENPMTSAGGPLEAVARYQIHWRLMA